MHKNTLDIVQRVQFHTAAPHEEFFSWGSRHHCPMEVERLVSLKYRSLFWTCSDSDVF